MIALALGLSAAGAPAGAQQRTPAPAPRACASCDSSAQAERDLLRAQQEVQRAVARYKARSDALQWSDDSSGEARAALVRAADELRRAQEQYRDALGAMMRQEMALSRQRGELFARRFRVAHLAAVPRGWLGVTFSGSYTVQLDDNGKMVMRFNDYPVIEAVDPESPAERAGLEARDRLVALAGRDVVEGAEPFVSLLQPGRHLPMTVRRGRSTKTVMVVVGKRPESDWPEWGWRTPMPAPAPPAPGAVPAPAAPAAPAAPSASAVVAVPAMPPMAPGAPMPPMPDVAITPEGDVRVEIVGSGMSPIAGAQLQRVGELRDYFGVTDGVLVLHVLPGTPAQRSGLRGGDVILRADGARITTPTSLARAMDRSDDRMVTLDIVRKKKKEKVVLRW
ncbi:MAG TPA: PDZ domain-containing protein [Gemmatimonadaceae bacterium]|nr:PDZ domain-containing protein [Gemmatimonadaceae bacterium]